MAERIIEEFIFEYWDCPKCGQKAIRGDAYKCDTCGYPRDNTITFYRKTEEEKIESKTEIDKLTKGPDWVCSFCESLNHQEDANCKGCGATKEDSAKNYFDELQKRKEKEEAKQKKEEEKNEPQKKSSVWLWISAAITLFVGFICWGTATHTEVYQVESAQWTRAIQILRYSWKEKSDWEGELSGDDRQIISKKSEIRRYDKVPAGTRTERYTDTERYKSGTREECSTSYKSTGSGASKKTTSCRDVPVYSTRNVTKTREVTIYKDVPVYDTKVYYKAKFYLPIGYVVENGKNNSPVWPNKKEGYGIDRKPDKSGENLESLVVGLKKEEGKKGPENPKLEVKEADFIKIYTIGSKVELKINNLGQIQFPNGEKEFSESEFQNKFGPVFQNTLN